MHSSYELLECVWKAADDKKAEDLVALDLRKVSDVADYFFICTANNKPQMDAVLDEIKERARLDLGVKPAAVELSQENNWQLIDFGSVVVHIFKEESRQFYRLENLWNDADKVSF